MDTASSEFQNHVREVGVSGCFSQVSTECSTRVLFIHLDMSLAVTTGLFIDSERFGSDMMPARLDALAFKGMKCITIDLDY